MKSRRGQSLQPSRRGLRSCRSCAKLGRPRAHSVSTFCNRPARRRSRSSPRIGITEGEVDQCQLPVLLAHRCQHVLAGRAHPDRAGMAGLEVRVGVLLPVALHVSPAAAANAHVASLDGSGLLPRRVVEVRLDRRGRATETVRDLLDREPLERDAEPSRRSAGGRGPMASQPRCTAGPLPPALNSRWSRRSGDSRDARSDPCADRSADR